MCAMTVIFFMKRKRMSEALGFLNRRVILNSLFGWGSESGKQLVKL